MTKFDGFVKIKSASHARNHFEKLPSYVSSDTLLSLNVIIYIAELLEKQNAYLAKISRKQPAAQHSVQRIGLWARIQKWFGAIANR